MKADIIIVLMMQVFSAFGFVHKITTFEKTAGFQVIKLFPPSFFSSFHFFHQYTSSSDQLSSHYLLIMVVLEVGDVVLYIYLNEPHCFLFLLCRHWFNFLIQIQHLLQRMLLMEEAFQGDFGFIVWLQALSTFCGSLFTCRSWMAGISWSCENPLASYLVDLV